MCLRMITAVLGLSAAWSAAAQPALKLHRPIRRDLYTGEAEVFTVKAAAGQFASVTARKMGVTVSVRVLDPAGKEIVVAASPNGAFGTEPAGWIAVVSGVYSVRVEQS